jgi:hypothetical protein
VRTFAAKFSGLSEARARCQGCVAGVCAGGAGAGQVTPPSPSPSPPTQLVLVDSHVLSITRRIRCDLAEQYIGFTSPMHGSLLQDPRDHGKTHAVLRPSQKYSPEAGGASTRVTTLTTD